MKYTNVLEEEIKNRVTQDFFQKFDCTKILGKIDFAVKAPLNPPKGGKNSPPMEGLREATYLLWAEAKQKPADILDMLTQLVLTIGKARTFDEISPPSFLGCYDSEKIAFVPYADIQDIFYQNDFNWKVAPSNKETREFKQVYAQIEKIITDIPWETYIFNFEKDEKELKRFIRDNFVIGKTGTTKLQIDKTNFIHIYNKWVETVKPTIAVNWDIAKKNNIIDGDFYLADLLSASQNDGYFSLKEKLSVFLKSTFYETIRHVNELGMFTSSRADFSDNQKAYEQFWAKYERPPIEEYWDYIVDHRHLLVPQDIRERKGSFYTPRIWVELSQKYIADVFGDNWQDEYYVWDCSAGTGNLLVGLVNKDNIWASTLDKQDVDVMYDRIENGANLWKQQIFQFDFLNDEFIPISKGGKLPDELYAIISDENKRKKLIIYINPPYAEASNTKAVFGTGNTKSNVSTAHNTKKKYKDMIGAATNEISAHFMARIFHEISGCKLALFSKFKFVCTQNFMKFRQFFKADFKNGFAVRACTFDNVTGQFPIGFTIWDLAGKKFPEFIEVDVPEENTKKKFFDDFHKSINQWIKQFSTNRDDKIGYLIVDAPDFQKVHQPFLSLLKTSRHASFFFFNVNNIIEGSIYFAVRLCVEATWLNDRDQFYFPNDIWKYDIEFQNDCLAFTLFQTQNRVSAKDGVNHWIPFTETEVSAKYKFESHFMSSFISGIIKQNNYANLFEQPESRFCPKREFSSVATKVFDAGRELWKYYHTQPKCNINASLYDIREHFQGRNDKGKMNNKSDDEKYNELIGNLRSALKTLAEKIEPKVYEYGFLKE